MYIFTFSLLGFFAVDDIFLKRGKHFLLFICIAVLWLIIHDGLRWGMATDWNQYHDFFANCLTSGNSEGFEPGYFLLNQAVRFFTENYTVFLVLHAAIVYVLITSTIFKYGVNPLFSIFFFYCMMVPYLGMNRQYIAFAICIYSYRFIFDQKLIYFILSLLLAFLFHKSAILFFPAYFLHREIPIKYIIIVLSISAIISLSGIINRLPLSLFFLMSSDKADFYGDNNIVASPVFIVLGLLKRSIWIIIALAFKRGIKNRDKYFNFFLNSYFIGAVIYIVFNNTPLQIVVARGMLYFNITEIFLIPYILTVFKVGKTKTLFFALVLTYGAFTIKKGFDAYIETVGFDIFRPYNFVFFDDEHNVYD